MATLFIHIGMPKAGSTSIQRSLYTSRQILAEHGVGHLSLASSHDRILLTLFRDERIKKSLHSKTYIQFGLDQKETEIDIDLLRKRLDDELAANTLSKFIVTGERLHRFDEGTPRIRDYFKKYFDDIRIVVYVREPVSWATSKAQHTVSVGKSSLESIYDFGSRPGRKMLPTYRKDLEPYIDLYGRDAVDIRIFDRQHFVGGTLMNDFCAAIGEPGLGEKLPEEVRNSAICYEGVMLQSEFHRAMSRHGEEIPKQTLKVLQRRLKELPGTKFSLPAPVAAEVRARVADDVAWLRETMRANVFDKPGASGAEPEWSDSVLERMSKVVRRLNAGVETDSPERAAWSEVFETLGLEVCEGADGHPQLKRKPSETAETAPKPAETDAAA